MNLNTDSIGRSRQDQRPSRLKPLMVALLAGLSSGLAAAADSTAAPAEVAESTFTLGGYVRSWASVNLQDQPETKGNDQYKLSTLRASVLLDADWKPTSSLRFKAIARLDREYMTDYLKSLEAPPSDKPAGSTAVVFSTNGGGNVGGLRKFYDNSELREWWGEADLSDRVKLKVGRQQIVWGETDFFRALDVVHGFNYTWRSFLEVENEELRKPLVMARAMIQVPEAKGSLDVFVRPGWDRDSDIGNTYDLAGGRWASQPTRGASFLYATSYNYRSEGANRKDATGGVRWQGIAGPVNYSLALLSTFNNDPVTNPCGATLAALYGGAAIPAGQASTYKTFKQAPKACGFAGAGPFGNPLEFGDWIFPKTSILGITASGFSPALNSVVSTEIAFQKDRSFNYGVDGGKYGPNITPGAFGIIQKNVLTMMFRVDHNVDLTNIIGTSRPSFGSIQFFNTQILDYKASDEIVQLAYWNRTRAKNSALLTGILAMNYSNDRINPSIAAGWDVSYGGGFLIPAVEWVLGDKWRLKAELDLFYSSGNEKKRYLNPATFQLEEQGRGAGLLGYFSGANQALLRLTRQF